MPYQDPQIGDTLTVRITHKNPQLGLFVITRTNHTGLIRKQNISWSHQNKFYESMQVGESVHAVVTNIRPDGKLELSRKEAYINPHNLHRDMLLKGVVNSVEDYGFLIRFDGFIGLASWNDLSSTCYKVGDEIPCVVKNVVIDDKGMAKVTVSTYLLHSLFAKTHSIGDRITAKYVGMNHSRQIPTAVISVEEGLFLIEVSEKYFIEPYKSELISESLTIGESLEFVYSSYNKEKSSIWLDMRPIEKAEGKKQMDELISKLTPGDVVMGEVIYVEDRLARVKILGSEVVTTILREELSPNKVLRASDEVFVGEHIKIVYSGLDEKNHVAFSRRYIIKDRYDENLYTLPLMDLLSTMGLKSKTFIGKAIAINGGYFFTEMITFSDADSEVNGRLLIDPINGKNILVRADNRLRNLITDGEYHKVEISLANEEYRRNEGTPYLFSVSSPCLERVKNPYKESVLDAFKQHTSPNTNTSVANLLEEVGQNLYSSKKRMFFELLQNADDAAAQNGVKVKIQLDDQYFLLTHDGYPFNKHDFESITSAAQSTKSANKKKTGYKGIGFKSVFTNSESVHIQSSGYRFCFDKRLPIYNDFDNFYFLVNNIEDDSQKQKEFIRKFGKFRREFKGVKDIPWQLLPAWSTVPDVVKSKTIWSNRENVCIALQMDEKTLSEYSQAILEVFSEPRFMLFLRRTNRIQLIQGNECRTIQKNISDNGKFISLVNSFDKDKQGENYKIYTTKGIEVSDEAFAAAKVNIKRKERTNIHGDIENYYVRIDSNGIEQSEVPGIPDRIASTSDTEIAFAVPLDEEGHITSSKDALSLYAYLPMNEHRFIFPLFINADFIPKSDREGVQSDNPWNHFLFFKIGQAIISMVDDIASLDEPKYLNLLLDKEFESTSQDTSALIDSFNNGYTTALSDAKIIINDKGENTDLSGIILDESSLATTVGANCFYTITGTSKRMPHPKLDAQILKKTIFNVEKTTASNICKIIQNNPEVILTWINSASEDDRNKFWGWLAKNEETVSLIMGIQSFKLNNTWISYNDAINKDKVILSTEKILPIKDLLLKLGFQCTDTIIEQHTLKDYFKKQDEKKLFDHIVSSDLSSLSYDERLRLFHATKNFDGVGDESRKKWAIFMNVKGVLTPLSKMCAFSSLLPSWLNDFMIASEEYSSTLDPYLINSENIYISIVEKNINSLLALTDIYSIYHIYRQNWRHAFTHTLINQRIAGILPVVEQEDEATKELYVKSLSSLDLISTKTYTSDSEYYRIIKLASVSATSCVHLRTIITIDGIPLSKITLKDDFAIEIDNVTYFFKLSSILPAYTDSSALSIISEKFKAILGYENVFAQSTANPSLVAKELIKLMDEKNAACFSADQYCFMVFYYTSQRRTAFDSISRQYINLTDTGIFLSILDDFFNKRAGEILRPFINNTYFSFGTISGRYINCANYTLVKERIQPFIEKWANTTEKQSFLLTLGAHNETSEEIKRRISFTENQYEDIWNISSVSTIKEFLSWVHSKEKLPISLGNKVKILKHLFKKIGIQLTYSENDYVSAVEWTDEKYLAWKVNNRTRIFLLDGKMPYRGEYLSDCMFIGKQGDFKSFSDSGHIYIDKNLDPEVVLTDVYSSNNRLFSKEDWREIFMVSRASVSGLISEIEELRKQNAVLRKQAAKSNDDCATMQRGEDSRLSKSETIAAQLEAQQALMRAYPDWQYPDGFGEKDEDGQPYCFSCNKIKTDNGDEPIVLKSFKYQGDKFLVNPTEYLYMIKDKAQLFIYDGFDFKRIPVLDLLRDQTKVSITFSSKNLYIDDKVEKLADALHYFNNIQFNFDSFNISNRAESIRHIYQRNVGNQISTSDDDL